MSGFTKSVAYPWALTGIFGAFHLVLTFIPYSVLGMGGGFLTWGMVSAPIVGFLLGPFYGTIAVLAGSLIGTGIFNLEYVRFYCIIFKVKVDTGVFG